MRSILSMAGTTKSIYINIAHICALLSAARCQYLSIVSATQSRLSCCNALQLLQTLIRPPGLAQKLELHGPAAAVSLKQLLRRRQLPVMLPPPGTVLPQVCNAATAEGLHTLIDVHEVWNLVPAGVHEHTIQEKWQQCNRRFLFSGI